MFFSKINNFLVFIYLLSLPFYSLRFTSYQVSISLVVLIVISIISVKNLFDSARYAKKYLLPLSVYLFIALVSMIIHGSGQISLFVLFKTTVYVVSFVFFSFSIYVSAQSKGEILIERAVQVSILIYSCFFLYVVIESGAWSSIFGGFSYWTFTYQVYSSMNSLLFGDTDFSSADVMRNTIAEIFVVFSIVLLGRMGSGKKTDQVLLAIGVLLILLTFSRRGLIEFGLCLAIYLYLRRSLKISLLFVFSGIVLFYISGQFDDAGGVFGRFDNFSEDGRIDQYSRAFHSISENVLFGSGYAAKLNGEKYVHNIVLASMFMMGMLGGVASLYIVYTLLHDFVSSIRSRVRSYHGLFLVVPIVGSQVGSTVEGLFSPGAWLAISFYLLGEKFRSMSKA